jgi:hypothetical protein
VNGFRRSSTWASASALIAAVTAVAAAYLYFISVGFTPKTLPEKGYHNRLAEGFLHRQLHILEAPSAELLAQQDPYDFETHTRFRGLWDASLYDGKYYFYWGPVPALLVCVVKLVSGKDTPVTDRQLVLVFQLGRLFIGAILLVLALRWLFPTVSPWLLSPAVLLWGLANPYLYELGRPGVYEVAIDAAAPRCHRF